MAKKPKTEQIADIIREETGRGRRPIDLEARRARARRLEDIRKLLRIATEEEFIKAMRAVGLREGSQEFLEALRIWHEYRS